MSCVVVGEFSQSKESLTAEIEANGGKVLANVTKSNPVTHILLGADGVTQYGQKTGRGSKKYREAMKKKPKPAVVNLEWMRNAIAKGVSVFESKEEEKKEEKKKGGTKRKAPEANSGEKGEKEKEEKEEEEGEGEKETKKAKTDTDLLYDEDTLNGMKRRELQALAKKHGIKGNSCNNAIIDELMKVKKE